MRILVWEVSHQLAASSLEETCLEIVVQVSF